MSDSKSGEFARVVFVLVCYVDFNDPGLGNSHCRLSI